MLQISSHVQSKQHFSQCFESLQAAEMGWTVHGIVQSVWIKDSGFQRISSSSSDTCRALLGRLPCTASQAKLFLFVHQHLFGRTKFSVTYNGQGAAFVLWVSINQCHHFLKAFWFFSFTFFIVYFGVEMLEQSVKVSELIIFYFISNFLLCAPILPKKRAKTSAFCSVFVLEQFFSSFRVVSVAKANVLETQTIAVFAQNWSRVDPNFAPFRWLIWVALSEFLCLLTNQNVMVITLFCTKLPFFLHRVT